MHGAAVADSNTAAAADNHPKQQSTAQKINVGNEKLADTTINNGDIGGEYLNRGDSLAFLWPAAICSKSVV